MRVVNTSRLWDNKRFQKPKRKAHIVQAMFFGVLFGAVLSLSARSVKTRATTSAPTPVLGVQTNAVEQDVTDQAEAVQKLLPVGDSFTTLPLQVKPEAPQPVQPQVDCSIEPCVALSFDDGPDPVNTPKILDSLDKQQIPATFFLIGYRVAPNAAIVQRMYHEGFEIGNHSWTHPDFTKLTAAQMTDQVDRTQAAITGLGIPAPLLFRPPYGAVNATLRATIHMPIIRWDVDPKDWAKTDPAAVIATVEAQAKPGAIILLHSTQAATAAAIDTVLANLKSRFHLVTVTQLLQLVPGAQGEYIGR